MKYDEEIRIKCLEIASEVEQNRTSVADLAKEFYKWVKEEEKKC